MENKEISELVKLHRQSKLKILRVFNLITCYISVSSGIIEIIRVLNENQTPSVISFFDDPFYDMIFSVLMIILGFLLILFQNKKNYYRIVIFLLTCLWGWIGFSYLFTSIFGLINYKYVLIIPVVTQLLYMMKTSVFIDENS